MKSFVRRRGWILAAALTMGLLAAPLTSSAAVSSQAETTDQVRTRLLGEGWNQPEVVRARWISNTTYLISYGGNVILHDTTIPQNLLSSTESNGYVTMDDIIAAQPEAILQDHDHFDQNRDAAQIASATGAPLVTTVTGCLAVKQDALVKGINPDTIHCDLLRDASGNAFTALDSFFLPYGGEGLITTAYGTAGQPETPIPGVKVTGVLIKHSVPRPYPENLTGPNLHPDITPLLKDPASLSTLENFGLTNDFEGGNVLYKVDYDGFSLVHHGSTGPTDSLEIGALQVKQALQKLGDNGRVDVELGGVAELTYFLDGNGFVDARKYSEDIGAKQYIPIHHSNWLPPLTNDAAYYYEPLKAEWAKSLVSQFPRMCFTTEQNWATVWSFNIAQWTGSQTGPMTPITGPGCYTG